MPSYKHITHTLPKGARRQTQSSCLRRGRQTQSSCLRRGRQTQSSCLRRGRQTQSPCLRRGRQPHVTALAWRSADAPLVSWVPAPASEHTELYLSGGVYVGRRHQCPNTPPAPEGDTSLSIIITLNITNTGNTH